MKHQSTLKSRVLEYDIAYPAACNKYTPGEVIPYIQNKIASEHKDWIDDQK